MPIPPIRNLRPIQAASQRPEIERLASQSVGQRSVDGAGGHLAPPMGMDEVAAASSRSAALATRLRIRPDDAQTRGQQPAPPRPNGLAPPWARRRGTSAAIYTDAQDPSPPAASGPAQQGSETSDATEQAAQALHRVVALSRQIAGSLATPEASRASQPSARTDLASAIAHQLGAVGAAVGGSTAALPGGESAASRLRLLSNRTQELTDRSRRCDERAAQGGPAADADWARSLARLRRLARRIDADASHLRTWAEAGPEPAPAARPAARAGGRFPLAGAVVREAAEHRSQLENLRKAASQRPDRRDSPWPAPTAPRFAGSGAMPPGAPGQPVPPLRANPLWNVIGAVLGKRARPVDRTVLGFADRAVDMGRSTVRFGRGASDNLKTAGSAVHHPNMQVDRSLLERADRAITELAQTRGFVPPRR